MVFAKLYEHTYLVQMYMQIFLIIYLTVRKYVLFCGGSICMHLGGKLNFRYDVVDVADLDHLFPPTLITFYITFYKYSLSVFAKGNIGQREYNKY
jgi:hypothetical protein